MPTERDWVDPETGQRWRVIQRGVTDLLDLEVHSRAGGGWIPIASASPGEQMISICGGFMPLAAIRWFLSVVEGSGNDDQ